MNDKKCCAVVYPKERWGAFHGYQCTRKASVERNGKSYCKTHDPEERKKREEKSLESYRAKQAARRAYEYVMARSLLRMNCVNYNSHCLIFLRVIILGAKLNIKLDFQKNDVKKLNHCLTKFIAKLNRREKNDW